MYYIVFTAAVALTVFLVISLRACWDGMSLLDAVLIGLGFSALYAVLWPIIGALAIVSAYVNLTSSDPSK
ncbi:MAG: hypothetical protein KF752_11920 [Pirellulaceae bacterium]|nr:hypothetical protein [Pirellulaceae bacterium]